MKPRSAVMSTIHKFNILHKSETDHGENEAFVFENASGVREIMTTINAPKSVCPFRKWKIKSRRPRILWRD